MNAASTWIRRNETIRGMYASCSTSRVGTIGLHLSLCFYSSLSCKCPASDPSATTSGSSTRPSPRAKVSRPPPLGRWAGETARGHTGDREPGAIPRESLGMSGMGYTKRTFKASKGCCPIHHFVFRIFIYWSIFWNFRKHHISDVITAAISAPTWPPSAPRSPCPKDVTTASRWNTSSGTAQPYRPRRRGRPKSRTAMPWRKPRKILKLQKTKVKPKSAIKEEKKVKSEYEEYFTSYLIQMCNQAINKLNLFTVHREVKLSGFLHLTTRKFPV